MLNTWVVWCVVCYVFFLELVLLWYFNYGWGLLMCWFGVFGRVCVFGFMWVLCIWVLVCDFDCLVFSGCILLCGVGCGGCLLWCFDL